MAFAYKGTVTITNSSTLLPSTQTNFPVLIKLDSVNCTVGGVNRIKTAANGGAVQNTGSQSGGNAVTMPFDLAFYSDAALTTKVPWEIKSYDGTGGMLWALVLMASCSLSANLYFGLGDAAVNSQQNTGSFAPSAVWDSNYVTVLNLPDGTTLFTNDSTTNALNFTNTNSVAAAAGNIDGCASFSSASSRYLTRASNALFNTTDYTIETWAFVSAHQALGSQDALISHAPNNNTAGHYYMYVDRISSKIALDIPFVKGAVITGATALSLSTWYHASITKSGNNYKVYLNGAQDAAITDATAPTLTGQANIGSYQAVTSHYLTGLMGQARISGIARSLDYMTATYQSGLDPQTFAAVSLVSNATGRLFLPPSLSGLGSGGPFFSNPLG